MLAWLLSASCLMTASIATGESDAVTTPLDARAAGKLGLVNDQGQWVTPDQVAARERSDARLIATRVEYARLRDQAPGTAVGQRRLAIWCEQAGLKLESLAHFDAVARLDPEDREAHARLGHRRYRDRWLTESEFAVETSEAQAQLAADRQWGPKLRAWREALTEAEGSPNKDEASRAVLAIRDPRAVAAIRRTFTDATAWEQRWAVRILGAIEAPRSSMELASLSVFGLDETVRQGALKPLERRDPRPFVTTVIQWFREPIKYRAEDSELLIEGASAILDRVYRPASPINNGELQAGRTSTSNTTRFDSTGRPQQFRVDTARRPVEDALAASRAVKKRQQEDVTSIERTNASISATNARVEKTLFRTTGVDLGTDPQVWNQWWNDDQGYSYQSPAPTTKPVIVETVQVTYVSPPPTVRVTPIGGATSHACFGAGTMVTSRAGLSAIEGLRVGDQVLTQDATSGVIDFRPVLAIFHNKPATTLRIKLGQETIVATPIHRFWLAGQGWAMARDLKPGDKVRTLGGTTEVVSISRDDVQPVFNLEVAGGHTFFVGNQVRALVHDNSVVTTVARPFDRE